MRRWHFYIGFAIRVIIIIEYSFFVLWTYAPVVSYQIRRWWSRVAPLWSRVVARSDLKKWFITRSKLDEFRIKRWCSVSSVQGIVLDSFGTKLTPIKIQCLDLNFFLVKVSESITRSVTRSVTVSELANDLKSGGEHATPQLHDIPKQQRKLFTNLIKHHPSNSWLYYMTHTIWVIYKNNLHQSLRDSCNSMNLLCFCKHHIRDHNHPMPEHIRQHLKLRFSYDQVAISLHKPNKLPLCKINAQIIMYESYLHIE